MNEEKIIEYIKAITAEIVSSDHDCTIGIEDTCHVCEKACWYEAEVLSALRNLHEMHTAMEASYELQEASIMHA